MFFKPQTVKRYEKSVIAAKKIIPARLTPLYSPVDFAIIIKTFIQYGCVSARIPLLTKKGMAEYLRESKDLMESAQAIWDRALKRMRPNITDISFSSWFIDLQPVALIDDVFILQTSSELQKSTLTNVYIASISSALNEVTGRELSVLLIDESQRSDYEAEIDINTAAYPSGFFSHNSKYTFDTFVIGESNRFAYAAAKAVAENPAAAYHPLFIYGGVGLGKTHLMHAIGHRILEFNSKAKVMYTTSETFTNELIQSIQDNRNSVQVCARFRKKYRNVDVLMIDDIQFIANKESTQSEFFHTFNSLKDANKQIIITSDKHPREIPMLEERLRTRFEWGLIADIQPPDFETRIAILKRKAIQEDIHVDDNVLAFIAEKISSNIRELEGSLNRIIAYAKLNEQPITLALTERALKDVIPAFVKKKITPMDIKRSVADFYGVKVEDLSAKRRDAAIAVPRQMAMYLCRIMTELSFPDIGVQFGGKHYSTVMYACDKIASERKQDPEMDKVIEDLMQRMKQ